jgi:hypothetical protein
MIGTHTPDKNFISINEGWFIKNNDFTKKFNMLGGIITDCLVETYTSKEGIEYEFIKLTITDEETYLVSLPVFGLGRTFMVICPNIDLSKIVEFRLSNNAKGRAELFILQDGKYLKYAFTKDNPKGMPEFEQKHDGKWDSSKQIEWLKLILNKYIISQIPKTNTNTDLVQDHFTDSFLDDDGLPF